MQILTPEEIDRHFSSVLARSPVPLVIFITIEDVLKQDMSIFSRAAAHCVSNVNPV